MQRLDDFSANPVGAIHELPLLDANYFIQYNNKGIYVMIQWREG
ncbi:MAG TPA: hypothetical protein VMW91_00820 [Desulfosporosinus sp.]|nr:hypothetical protein [Desulfosporosinus sp.]